MSKTKPTEVESVEVGLVDPTLDWPNRLEQDAEFSPALAAARANCGQWIRVKFSTREDARLRWRALRSPGRRAEVEAVPLS